MINSKTKPQIGNDNSMSYGSLQMEFLDDNSFRLVDWLVVFNVPSTARSFRDGTPNYCPLRRTWSSINTPFRPGIELRNVARQSITLPLRYASSTTHLDLYPLVQWGTNNIRLPDRWRHLGSGGWRVRKLSDVCLLTTLLLRDASWILISHCEPPEPPQCHLYC